MTKTGYAVVGLGIGRAHASAAHELDCARLVALCDVNEEKLRTVGADFEEARLYTSFEEMLANDEIEIVSICVPSGMHADLAVQAMRAGKNVLIEKPIEITPERAMLIEAARLETGMTVGVIHQNRFNVCMPPIKEAVESGKLGRLMYGNFAVKWLREQGYYDNGGWRGTWEMDGGGSLMNQAVHTVDLMQWLMGDVHSVTSAMNIYNHDIKTEDFTASIVKFKSGATATFVSSTVCYPGISTDIQLYGTLGSVHADADKLTLWKIRGEDAFDETDKLDEYGQGNLGADGHKVQVEDIIHSVREGCEPFIPPMEAVKSVRIVNAVYESARTGKEVLL